MGDRKKAVCTEQDEETPERMNRTQASVQQARCAENHRTALRASAPNLRTVAVAYPPVYETTPAVVTKYALQRARNGACFPKELFLSRIGL
jgi:hypothetical protein